MELFLLPFSNAAQLAQFKQHIQHIKHLKSTTLSSTLLSCISDSLFTTYHEMDCQTLLETLRFDLGDTLPFLHGNFHYDTLLIQKLATTDVWQHITINKTSSIEHLLPLLASHHDLQMTTHSLLDEVSILTLKHYFENNLNVIQTAKEMYIHRNSLNYRLTQIHQKTGIDPRSFYGAMYFFQVIFASALLSE